ncbi:sigma-70 family RNA polymerase sigma factor [Thalassotalea sp. ND16A]|uniref:sigma-70 family RNA polymerase sigma factor n=1 Tax=Thalassotalea sp. ND16A TaxID=1535422 RepID=UPI00051A304E|nr:sigma-70 family RNA polymerase sigma factor [Thalassotalea sp. ND16A]KGK00735.1 RNA polymerase, sigma-24 subunit, ECF subfamily [Thalassotalea sp. ND16A]
MASKQVRYEALVNALHADLYRYAYWLVHDKHVAEDLVQETFLRAWRALDSLKDQKAAKSWLITILRRENARRFERKQFEMSEYDEGATVDNWSTSTEQQLEDHWLREKIAKLPAEYREPLVLQVIGGFSGEEIAGMLDLNKNTVMTRLFRARNQLRDAVEQDKAIKGRYNG